MIEPHLNFKRLKALVSIEHLLASRGLDANLRRTGNRLVGPCPIHHGDNPRAFVVNRETDTWYCFTGCSAGGDVVELVRRLEQCSYRDAAHLLASLAGDHNTVPPQPPTAEAPSKPEFRPFTRQLRLDPDDRFLVAKGIRSSTARRFEAGRYHGRGFLEGCVAVRIHDDHGRPLGYAGRRLDPDEVRHFGKWKLPPRLPKTRLLYNFHRVVHRGSSGLVIVECPWGVMRLAQLRIPAVALLGTHLSEHHRELLHGFDKIIIMLDGDRAGTTAGSRIRQQLAPQVEVRVVPLPDGLDPDDLSDQQLTACLKPFFFL